MKKLLPFILFTISFSTIYSQKIDMDHSYALFKTMYLKNQIVEGRISGFEGEVFIKLNNISASTINLTADASSLTTSYVKRDTTLIGKNYLYAAKYPKITFKSTKFEIKDKGYIVTGNLTVRDKTEEIEIFFKPEEFDRKLVLDGNFTINRYDFDVGENVSTISVSEDVSVEIHCVIKTK